MVETCAFQCIMCRASKTFAPLTFTKVRWEQYTGVLDDDDDADDDDDVLVHTS